MMQACDHPAPRTVEIRDYGFDETARTALVVGAGGDPEEAVVALTLLALDPETKAAAIVVSTPPRRTPGSPAKWSGSPGSTGSRSASWPPRA
jgi:hypothetical protein